MFDWLKKKPEKENRNSNVPAVTPPPAPPIGPPKPAKSPHDVSIGYANGQRTWSEHFNLIDVTAKVLQKHGHRIVAFPDRLEDQEHGFVLRPKLEGFQPIDRGGARTTTTMHITHPSLFATPVFEFQHSVGQSAEDSIAKGIDQWAQVDYAVFLEAMRDKPAKLTMLGMTFPAKGDGPERHRRVLLGPVAHFQQKPPPAGAARDPHPFCSCCLLTKSFEAFKPLLESDGFYGLRMFAAREQDGGASADCRVNGEEFEEGKVALRKYVQSWPGEGFEFRKQYVIIQSVQSA